MYDITKRYAKINEPPEPQAPDAPGPAAHYTITKHLHTQSSARARELGKDLRPCLSCEPTASWGQDTQETGLFKT